MEEKFERVKIACEMTPAEGEGKIQTEIALEGRLGDMLFAYKELTVKIMGQLIEHGGIKRAKAAYAGVQMEALEEVGIDPEEEAAKASAAVVGTISGEELNDILKAIFGEDEEDKAEEETDKAEEKTEEAVEVGENK